MIGAGSICPQTSSRTGIQIVKISMIASTESAPRYLPATSCRVVIGAVSSSSAVCCRRSSASSPGRGSGEAGLAWLLVLYGLSVGRASAIGLMIRLLLNMVHVALWLATVTVLKLRELAAARV